MSIDKLDEAASELVILVNEDKDVSEQGKTSFQVCIYRAYQYHSLCFSFGTNCAI